jgi:D-alanyl-D-alanine carboxypeptidase (penicillin-binding protein 5/6)
MPTTPNSVPRSLRRSRGTALVLAMLTLLSQLIGCRPVSHGAVGVDGLVWPAHGQAALGLADGRLIGTSGDDGPVPIASVAKVMTAYVVLSQRPLASGEEGFVMTVTASDVEDTAMRVRRHESVVEVKAGQRLTQRDALLALLLPSANNVAAKLAVETAGSVERFVDAMNAQARRLGMHDTVYTDPSGFDAATVSTAADQLRLARAAMEVFVLRELVRRRTAEISGIGEVENTNTLLGHNGFVGLKTGSHRAAGGCFMFANLRRVGSRDVVVLGVVLGQRGGSRRNAALGAADRLVRSYDETTSRDQNTMSSSSTTPSPTMVRHSSSGPHVLSVSFTDRSK